MQGEKVSILAKALSGTLVLFLLLIKARPIVRSLDLSLSMIELVKELDVNAGAVALFDRFALGEQPNIECNQLRLAGGFGDQRLGWISVGGDE